MTKFSVPEMSCGHCKAKIEDAILDADEGAQLDFDLEAREVDVDTTLSVAEVVAAISAGGFEASERG